MGSSVRISPLHRRPAGGVDGFAVGSAIRKWICFDEGACHRSWGRGRCTMPWLSAAVVASMIAVLSPFGAGQPAPTPDSGMATPPPLPPGTTPPADPGAPDLDYQPKD